MLRVTVKKALPDFNLEVDFTFDNGITVLFGPSGSGKTTLLQCISGLSKPEHGKIALFGNIFYSSEQNINIPARARNIGYVFQDYALFPHMTVKQNAMYGVKGCKGRNGRYRLSVKEVLDILKITHLQDRYPEHLSGGERQRVALARALMTEPDLLLLDEPLSALDEDVRAELRSELKALHHQWDIPFVLVTHSRTEMEELADNIIFLEGGRQSNSTAPYYGPLRRDVPQVDKMANFGII